MGTRRRLLGTAAPFTRFTRREDGNVATWFGLLLVPMLGMTFGAIEYAELAEQRSSMTDAMDAAALGIARQYEILDIEACDVAEADESDDADPDLEDKRRLERFGQEFFAENYPEFTALYADEDLSRPLDLARDLDFALTCDDVTVSVTAWTDMGGVLARRFGVGAVPLDLETQITLFQQSRMEVALVLDVTGSMGASASGGGTRMEAMKTAVEGMLDHDKIFGEDDENDRVKFSIVPFNTFVNVGADYASTVGTRTDSTASWLDGLTRGSTPRAHYHGAQFFHAWEDGTVNLSHPGDAQPNTLPSVRLSVSDRKVNHFDLFRSVGDDGAPWKGCVEARPFPLDEIPHRPGVTLSGTGYMQAFARPSDTVAAEGDVNATIDAAWRAIGAPPTNAALGYDPRSVANSRLVAAFMRDGPDCGVETNYDITDCTALPNRNDDPERNLDGRAWGEATTISYSYANSRGVYRIRHDEIGPLPRQLFNPVVGVRENGRFVADVTFLGTKPRDPDIGATVLNIAELNDKHRYRNLAYDVFQHGLNGAEWGPGEFYSQCLAPSAPYSFRRDVRDLMTRFNLNACLDEDRLRTAYVGIYQAGFDTYKGKYDDLEGSAWSGFDDLASYEAPTVGPNTGCSGPILPLTSDRSEIDAVMEALEPYGGTNTAIGMAWGWRTLTHEAPFVEAANTQTAEGRNWYKIAILLTDGDNSNYSGDHRTYTAYGRGAEDRVRAIPAGINFGEAIDYKTIRMCHRMRAEGIKVYTIGFAITSGSRADRMLKACAVDEDANFLAANASDLNDAFDEIADQVTELHISG